MPAGRAPHEDGYDAGSYGEPECAPGHRADAGDETASVVRRPVARRCGWPGDRLCGGGGPGCVPGSGPGGVRQVADRRHLVGMRESPVEQGAGVDTVGGGRAQQRDDDRPTAAGGGPDERRAGRHRVSVLHPDGAVVGAKQRVVVLDLEALVAAPGEGCLRDGEVSPHAGVVERGAAEYGQVVHAGDLPRTVQSGRIARDGFARTQRLGQRVHPVQDRRGAAAGFDEGYRRVVATGDHHGGCQVPNGVADAGHQADLGAVHAGRIIVDGDDPVRRQAGEHGQRGEDLHGAGRKILCVRAGGGEDGAAAGVRDQPGLRGQPRRCRGGWGASGRRSGRGRRARLAACFRAGDSTGTGLSTSDGLATRIGSRWHGGHGGGQGRGEPRRGSEQQPHGGDGEDQGPPSPRADAVRGATTAVGRGRLLDGDCA